MKIKESREFLTCCLLVYVLPVLLSFVDQSRAYLWLPQRAADMCGTVNNKSVFDVLYFFFFSESRNRIIICLVLIYLIGW